MVAPGGRTPTSLPEPVPRSVARTPDKLAPVETRSMGVEWKTLVLRLCLFHAILLVRGRGRVCVHDNIVCARARVRLCVRVVGGGCVRLWVGVTQCVLVWMTTETLPHPPTPLPQERRHYKALGFRRLYDFSAADFLSTIKQVRAGVRVWVG